tara:strand:- start:12763 stop:14538 length:1776 start_codon:yes stop_codon:yes gene_type:complete
VTFPSILQSRVADAIAKTSKADDLPDGFSVDVVSTQDPKFGDYQCNAAMVLAKRLKTNPRAFAAEVVELLDADDLIETPEIAGPGFLNFRLKPEVIANRLLELVQDERLGVPLVENPQTIVIDFSAPNVAKQMHVGHIRSTIIGDCLARVSRFLGHNVITDNHIGDWGTQFGMILYGWKNLLDEEGLKQDPIVELLRVYKAVNVETKDDESILDLCREELVKLQQGDAENLEIWKKCVELSLQGLAKIYDQLDIRFDHFLGESFYNDALQPLVEELKEKGIATESDGAICVFSDNSAKPENDPLKIQKDGEWRDIPCMIQKSDGGFNYATTDLATIDYRVNEWNADQIWYVVGAPQQLHFRQVFEVTRMRGQNPNLVHVAFGSILGKDRKMFKTRSGQSVGLQEVLTESIERAAAFLDAREAEDDKFTLPAEEKPKVAQVIGISSVKYAELSQGRMTDYIFDWDKMLSLKGNTAPYLLYSYVRTRGIFRKLDQDFVLPAEAEITEPAERILAMALLRFGEIVPDVLNDHRPNVLAAYLYDLAKAYHSFFQACHVLSAEGTTRETRLLLCEATSRVLQKGLGLLGIETIERM